MQLRRLLQCHSLGFILGCALFFTLSQNALFLYTAWSHITFDNIHSIIFAATMPVVIFCALNIIFSVLAIPFLRKPLIIFLLLGSTITNYFMFSYGTVIDGNSIQNLFEASWQEVIALLTPHIGLWLLLGIIPSLAVGWIQIHKTRPWWYMIGLHAANVMLSVVVILLVAALFYKDYVSLLRNNKSLVKMLTPTNFMTSTVKFAKYHYFSHNLPLVKIGEDAHLGPLISGQAKKTLLILVIGKNARAENFSLGGYPRETNPRLQQNNVVYFKNTRSCGTDSATSIPCMFSNMSRNNYNATLAAHQEGLMDILAHAGVNVLWRDNSGGCKGVCDRIPHIDMTKLQLPQYCDGDNCMDNVLLHKLGNYIDSLKSDSVIVLHQIGSYGPAYYRRSTAEFRQFLPTCDSNQIQGCTHAQLVNTYDNSLLYTDAMLGNTIALLQQYSGKFNTAMVYLADHGESLGENGIYLHGTPYLFAPSQQTHVPFLMWMSAGYQYNFGVDRQCLDNIAAQDSVSQDNLFHTMLGMLNVQTHEYQPQWDILQHCRKSDLILSAVL
ncbi:hydrolase [Chania multitudinisentens RB-25]|uniref:Hydrolase n=1 Tax=Chania multitudinisentens RB-25 TaxID=1441930 RepID=W0LKA2_9GAMM|nr:phosphoethanolamine transferase EptA [Chania multitudinisentens]AHG22385.1 hydrolase [Chania multitudinisentens RB-25]